MSIHEEQKKVKPKVKKDRTHFGNRVNELKKRINDQKEMNKRILTK